MSRTCVCLSIEFVVWQLLDLKSPQSARFRLAETLGQAQQRLVVLRLARVGRIGLGLSVRRQREHGSVNETASVNEVVQESKRDLQEVQQNSRVG